MTTTLHRSYRSWTGPRAAEPLPPAVELIATLPATWRPVPPEQRDTMLAFCSRCWHLARLPLGPGDALCDSCRLAEAWDRGVR